MSNNSMIHKINPVIKIICLLIMILIIIISNTITSNIIGLSIIIILAYSTNIEIYNFINKLLNYKYILLLIFIFNLFLKMRINLNIIIILKLIEFILYAYIVGFTTSNNKLYYGLNKIIYPIKYLKLNNKEISFSLFLSLQFILKIKDQTKIIIKSLKSKNINYANNNFLKKLLIIKTIFIPVILSSITQVNKIINNMEIASYSIHAKRTNYHKYKIRLCDIIYIALHISLLILIMKQEVII